MTKKQHRIVGLFLLLIALISASCQEKTKNRRQFTVNGRRIEITLLPLADTIFELQATVKHPDNTTTTSQWKLHWPVFHWECGDITADGIPEIAVGVIKPTRFDPVPRKRLFLFKLADTCYIRPLWLGTHLAKPLVDFTLSHATTGNYIRTIEQDSAGLFAVVEYQWKCFGPEWVRYLQRNINQQNAKK
jgi:hypothetical protein